MTSIHPLLGDVTLSLSPRARRITISVRSTGAVRLTYPRGVSAKRAMEFLDSKAEWVERARVRLAARKSVAPSLTQGEIEELRRAAKNDLPERVERLSRLTGLKYTRLTIRAMRSKWGSCTGKNAISLSVFLMLLPEHLRDFVIIHELCHTVHHNHSPRFHALVDKLVGGNEKTLNRELRAFSIRK